jgi:uncharacterized protein
MIALLRQNRLAIEALCQRFHVRRLDVFGSAAQGGFDPRRSDLDFVVTLEGRNSGEYADNFLGLARALEDLFQRKVDLITERSIRNPYFREAVEESRQLIYEA